MGSPIKAPPGGFGTAAAETAKIDAETAKAQAEGRRVAALKEQGLDSRGLTIRPEFADVFAREPGRNIGGFATEGKRTDQLREGFRIGEFDAVNLDSRALDRITEEGLSEGVTRGGQRQLDAQGLEQARSFDQLRRGNAGAQAQAQNALAAQGGLSGGARERLARSGQRNALIGRQDVRGQGAIQRAGILSGDEQAKRQLLGQAQQGALEAGKFGQQNRQFEATRREFDIKNALAEVASKRDADIRAFEADRQAEAAGKQADAQRASACFAEGTMLPMADGTYKRIEDIKLGECLKAGGTIHLVLSSILDTKTDVYNYGGVLVTGCHAVLEDNQWHRVKDSKKAVIHDGRVGIVYTLANELHLIEAAGILFADYEETDDFQTISDDESLERLNSSLNKRVRASEPQHAFC